jgi:PhoPQ-activated pathogenicity-related protein
VRRSDRRRDRLGGGRARHASQPAAAVHRLQRSKDKARYEDDLIAYTRVRHFATQDDFWLVRLAMLNSEAITRHHFEAYGFFSPALKDYVAHGLFPHRIGTPEYRAVLRIEDPYEYRSRERLRIAKFLINASGDQFFLPDNARFYFHDLPPEKHLRYVPNARHNLAGSDATASMIAFYRAILAGTARPRYSWTKQKDGSLAVQVTDRPDQVNLWQATNPQARDFRLDTIGPAYTSTPLPPGRDGGYLARVTPPAGGYTAAFVELVYGASQKYPLKFTTEVSVVPDRLPYRFADAARKYAGTAP